MAIPIGRRKHFSSARVSCSDAAGQVAVTEKSAGGAGSMIFSVNAPHTSLHIPVSQSATWLGNQKCADGAILVDCPDGLHVHLVELKSKITSGTWEKIKQQYAGLYHNVIALGAVANLDKPVKISCHLAYTIDGIAASPVLAKAVITSGGLTTPPLGDWIAKSIAIDDVSSVEVHTYIRDADGNAQASIDC